jgi:hypothetical protein
LGGERKEKMRRLLFLGATIVVLAGLAAAGTAIATIPDSGGVIHGCYLKKTGALRVIDEGQQCTKLEHQVDWSQEGPQGLQGPQGLPGITNIADVYARVAKVTTPPGDDGSPLADCDPGDQVVSGGFYTHAFGATGNNVQVRASYPQMPEDGWQIFAHNGESVPVDIYATVVCLDLTP